MDIVKTIISEILGDSTEDESDEDLLHLEDMITNCIETVHGKPACHNRTIIKNQHYFETIKRFQPDVFKAHFRISKSVFDALVNKLQPIFNQITSNEHGGRPNLILCNRVLLCLWTLANPESFRGIADRFGVGKGTSHNVFIEMCELIASMEKDVIVWPSDYEATSRQFEALRGINFPGIIGAPLIDKSSYFNRKGHHSVKLQGICDSLCKFTDVFIGIPGSCHDAHMWKCLPIYQKLSRDCDSRYHLLGDSAYPLDKFILKPYRDNGHLTQQKKKFNYYLSSHRVVIENVYGILKGKFRRLKALHMLDIEKLPKVVMACCVLHNLALESNDTVVRQEIQEENSATSQEDEEVGYDVAHKRDVICAMLNL